MVGIRIRFSLKMSQLLGAQKGKIVMWSKLGGRGGGNVW